MSYDNYYIPSLKKKKIDFFNFKNAVNGRIDGLLGKNTLAKTCYNFDYTDGGLKCGVGVKQLEILVGDKHYVPAPPKNLIPKKVFYYKRYDDDLLKRDDRILVYYADGSIYEWKIYGGSGEMTKVTDLNFSSVPFSVNYRLNSEDVILFSTKDYSCMYDGSTVSEFTAPHITSLCVHNERLYATTGNSETELWFSKTFDPTNWNVSLDEGGFIDFRTKAGRLIKVVSFGGYLYAFANYGIFRISSYGDQLETVVDAVYLNSGRIYKNSVTECGKYVVYLAEDGFYRFDGSNSYKIMTELDEYLRGVDNEDVSAIYHNGKFYATVTVKNDGKLSKTVVCYDLNGRDFYLAKGLNAYDFEKIDGDEFSFLAILVEGYSDLATLSDDGAKFGLPLTKLWRSYPNDFDVFTKKTLSYVSLYCKGVITLEFESDEGKKTVEFFGGNSRKRAKIGLRGNDFTVTVKSRSKNAEVSKMLLEIQYV